MSYEDDYIRFVQKGNTLVGGGYPHLQQLQQVPHYDWQDDQELVLHCVGSTKICWYNDFCIDASVHRCMYIQMGWNQVAEVVTVPLSQLVAILLYFLGLLPNQPRSAQTQCVLSGRSQKPAALT